MRWVMQENGQDARICYLAKKAAQMAVYRVMPDRQGEVSIVVRSDHWEAHHSGKAIARGYFGKRSHKPSIHWSVTGTTCDKTRARVLKAAQMSLYRRIRLFGTEQPSKVVVSLDGKRYSATADGKVAVKGRIRI